MRFCGGGIGHINQDCRWKIGTIGEVDDDDGIEVDSNELAGASGGTEAQSTINPESEGDSDSDSDRSSDSDSSSSVTDDSDIDSDMGPEDGEGDVDHDDDGYASL